MKSSARSLVILLFLGLAIGLWTLYPSHEKTHEIKKVPKLQRIDKAIEQEFEMTKDPTLNEVPRQRLFQAKRYADSLRVSNATNRAAIANITWTERGPSNVSGRTRAILIDANDGAGNTIWAGSVGGGLWKSTNAGNSWTPVNELFDNLAIASIAQDPSNPNIIYFGTGEGFFNADAIRGLGIWKTTDGGNTWNQLSSTNNSTFYYVQKIVVNSSGTVYACTRDGGVQRSTNGGSSWSKVLGSGAGASANRAADIELASNGDLYAAMGLFQTDGIYKSTNGGTSWSKLTGGGLPSSGYQRIELACAASNANVVYALMQGTNYDCSGIYRTDNGGSNWTSLPVPGAFGMSNFCRGQAWYDLICGVDPNNSNRVFIGGIDLLVSGNGGSSWSQVSQWYGGGGYQYMHADQHAIVFQNGNSKVIWFGNDGGVYRTTNGTAGTPTISFRGNGYNVTQYYAADLNRNSGSNNFLAGAQDNGTQKYTSTGINSTTEVSGGDGAFCHIDANQPNTQISSYVYNNYYITTNNWGSSTSRSIGSNAGRFINPTDYDSDANVLYACYNNGTYSLITSVGGTNSTGSRSISQFNNAKVSCVSVSPNVSNRVYFGLDNGDVVRVDNSSASSPSATIVRAGSGYTSSVSIEEGNENHLLVTYSNYGVNSVYESTNGGSSWTSVEGNLPDMPIRWSMFDPSNSDQALLATELGVWSTDDLNGTSTNWGPTNGGLANVRTDMLQYRTSDNTAIAATHGRGLFSTILPGGSGGGGPTCSATINSYPYAESFESGLGDWSQEGNDDLDWTQRSGGTPSSGTGPSGASDGTFYYYVETSSPNYPSKTAILNGPCYDLTGVSNPEFTFDYHMLGNAVGTLSLEASTDGTTWSSIWSLSGTQGSSWLTANVDLSAYGSESELRLRFVGTSGSSWQGDLCIDALGLSSNSGGGGGGCQDTEVTMTIVLDNYPSETTWELRDGSGALVTSGGPYATQGATVTETFCLPDDCYDYTIFDSYGDGICCSYGNGSYELVDDQGTVLASGGAFGSSETTNFCIGGPGGCPTIDFSATTINSYGGSQDNGSHQVQDGGQTLFIQNNAWKSISYNYTVTANTVVEFEFYSTLQGEIHGVAFDNDNNISSNYTFRVYGTQNWGIGNYDNYPGSGWVTYTIPVGSFYTGTFDRLCFVADHDSSPGNGNAYFRNVKVYEGSCGPVANPILSNKEEIIPIIGYEGEDDLSLTKVWPNPFKDFVQVTLPGSISSAEVELLDIYGRVLETRKNAAGTVRFEPGNALSAGIYIIRVRHQSNYQDFKVVFQK